MMNCNPPNGPRPNFDSAAEELRLNEFARLTAATVPTLDGLRALNVRQLRVRVATGLCDTNALNAGRPGGLT